MGKGLLNIRVRDYFSNSLTKRSGFRRISHKVTMAAQPIASPSEVQTPHEHTPAVF